jgi:hypothetical protein
VYGTCTDPTGNHIAIRGRYLVSTTVDNSNPSTGHQTYAIYTGSNNLTATYTGSSYIYGGLIGYLGGTQSTGVSGSGSIDTVVSIGTQNLIRSSISITNAFGVLIQTAYCDVGSATLTNAYGIYIETPAGSLTLSNFYGLYIPNITVGGTVNWSIYVGGNSYFGGNIQNNVLTASYPVVTDPSKNLASVSYSTFKSSLSIAQADVSGLTTSSSPTFQGLSISGATSSPNFYVNSSIADPASVYYGIESKYVISTTGNNSNGVVGVYCDVRYTGSNSLTRDYASSNYIYGSLIGLQTTTYGIGSGGAGTVDTMIGVGIQNCMESSITVTNSMGILIQPAFCDSGTATVTNAYGIYIKTPATATVTNFYGLYLPNITIGGTINWSIYAAGSSYFGITVGINCTTPGTLQGGWNYLLGKVLQINGSSGQDACMALSSGSSRYARMFFENQLGTAGNRVVEFLQGGDYLDIRSLNEASGSAKVDPILYLNTNNGYVGISVTPSIQLHQAQTYTLTGALTDGYSAGHREAPTYDQNYTVTRHNYLDLNNVTLTNSAACTDAAVMRFNAAAGTHLATVGATSKATPSKVSAWIKVNMNGTIMYVPVYSSTTS